jgi:hypothetical protein
LATRLKEKGIEFPSKALGVYIWAAKVAGTKLDPSVKEVVLTGGCDGAT